MNKIIFFGDKVRIFVDNKSFFTIPYDKYKQLWTKEGKNMKREKRSSK
ncbi:MAG: hypothetical protein ACOCT9_00865 [archaeon]